MHDREEPGKFSAGVLAVIVHVLFFGLLIFGVNWHTKQPEAVEAELWSSLPPVPKPRAVAPQPKRVKQEPKPKPEPEPKPKQEPVKPKPVKQEPKPEPKPKVAKADIELKQKEQKRREEEKRKEEERKKEQTLKRKQQADALKQLLQQQQTMEAELLRQQQLALQQQLQAQQSAAQASTVSHYKSRIRAKFKRYVILPPDIQGNPQAEFDVTLLPGGDVLDVKLTRSSGNAAYDEAVKRAIYKAVPLPLPPGGELFSAFRELHLQFRPKDDN